MRSAEEAPYLYQKTLNDGGDTLQNMETIQFNQSNPNEDFKDAKYKKGILERAVNFIRGEGSKSIKNENDNDNDNDNNNDNENENENENEKKDINEHDNDKESIILDNKDDEYFKNMIESNKNSFLKAINRYRSSDKYKIDPLVHVEGSKEIDSYIIKKKVHLKTYVQYIDVYEQVTGVEEGIDKEELIYEDIPKYVTKYVPKIVTETVEKTIEVPSGEEIKNPIYNTVNIPYIIPNIVENEILVVLKKIIKPEIEVSNEVLEVEVEKYVPRLIPVNVYVPRYFAISAKTKGTPKESFNYIDLTPEQYEAFIKELNPHLDELELFNECQLKKMNDYIKESQIQTKEHKLEPINPQIITYDKNGNSVSFDYSEFDKIKESYLKQASN